MKSAHVLLVAVFVQGVLLLPIEAQGEMDFWTSTLVRSNVNEAPAFVGQVVGSVTPDFVLRNDFELEVWDGDLPNSAGPVFVIPAGQDYPREVYAADLDGDGDQDLLDIDPGASLRVHRQVAGTFVSQTLDNSIATSFDQLRLVDFDGTGRKHIVVGVQIYLQQPDDSFLPVLTHLAPLTARFVNHFSADYDGDGDMDVVVTYQPGLLDPARVRTWRQTAPNVFTQVVDIQLTPSSDEVDLFEPADFDQDGVAEFLLVSRASSSSLLRIRRYEITSSFSLANRQELKLSSPSAFTNHRALIADLNGDVLPDVLISRRALSPSDDEASLLLRGTLGGGLEVYTGWGISLLPVTYGTSTLLDLDNNGGVELVRHDHLSGQIRSYSAGPLGFTPTLSFTSSPNNSVIPSPALLSSSLNISTIWTAQTPAGPRPLRHRATLRELVNSNSEATFLFPSGVAASITDGQGVLRSTVFTGTVPGVATLRSFGFALSSLNIAGNVHLISGADLTISVNHTAPPPIVVRATNTQGAPYANIGVVVIADTPGITLTPPHAPFTNMAGESSFLPLAPQGFIGTVCFTIQCNGVGAITTTRTFTNSDPQISIAGGDLQASTLHFPFAQPLEVLVQDSGGLPMPGVQVSFSGPSSVLFSHSQVLTDASGMANTLVTPEATGPVQIQASLSGFPSVTFNLFARGLSSVKTQSTLLVILRHENAGMPFLLASDVPQTPIPFPPFGDLYTSVLAPGPNFGWRDGLGIFAPADPSLVISANSAWIGVFPISPSLAGQSIVMQTYGVDANYPFPASVVISNPVLVTF